MNLSSLKSQYCKNVEEELSKIAIEQFEEDMEEIIKHFHMLNNQLLDKSRSSIQVYPNENGRIL